MIITKENIKKEEINPEDIWAKMVDFGKYGFNKSHSVSYALIGYWTSWLWVEHRDEFLTFELNYDTKTRYQQAIDKCVQLGMTFVYPTINNMMGNYYLVKNRKVHIPAGSKKNYTSYVDFLFNDENEESVAKLIYKGVCDKLTKDRFALAQLATTLLKKPKDQAVYMEPEDKKFINLTQILDGLKMCGAVVDYKKGYDEEEKQKGIRVFVKRGRGNPSEIFFHENGSDICRAYAVKYDTKEFGSVRPGVLSNQPEINTSSIERTINSMRERYIERGFEDKLYYALKDELDNYMKKYFSNDMRRIFEDIYAVYEDSVVYERNAKLIISFNNKKNEIFYTYDKEIIKKFRTFTKGSLIKLKLEYSPFIQKRTKKFILDFDILDVEEIPV